MGAQSSHHEPLNVGGITSNNAGAGSGVTTTSASSSSAAAATGGLAPDFSRGNSYRASTNKKKTSLASKALNPRNTIRKSIRKRREKRLKNKENWNNEDVGGGSNSERKVEGPTNGPLSRGVGMDKLRRSFRDSFRKKKDNLPEASKPHQWQHDETAVRDATCTFPVKYLGCVEVFESRGMQVCEEALKVLRASRRRPIRGMLHVSGDGLRVVDDETKGLLVDQTIEKVSFCAPDRNHERGFSYICRDGTTRRWMCHGFVAVKETGERLSHAVGCAFAACLDRKQKRDKECGVTMTFDQNNSTFTRMGSFKQMTITDRLSDPQECKPNGSEGVTSPTSSGSTAGGKASNPHAIARPHATPLMLQRQGSCRVFHHLNQSSPFKRQLSLRLNELPSNMERQRSHSLTTTNIFDNGQATDNANNTANTNGGGLYNAGLGDLNFPSDAYNNNGSAYTGSQSGPFPRSQTTTSIIMSSIPEGAAVSEEVGGSGSSNINISNGGGGGGDAVSAMCQQLSQGLSLLSSDPFANTTKQAAEGGVVHSSPFTAAPKVMQGAILVPSVEPIREDVPWSSSGPTPYSATASSAAPATADHSNVSKAEEWLAQLNASTAGPRVNGSSSPNSGGQHRNPALTHLRANSLGAAHHHHHPQQQQQSRWTPASTASGVSSYPAAAGVGGPSVAAAAAVPQQQQQLSSVNEQTSLSSRPVASSRPMLAMHQSSNFSTTLPSMTGQVAGSRRPDLFESEWVSPLVPGAPAPSGTITTAAPPLQGLPPQQVNPNNPFLPANSVTKAFEVQM